jgi:hypothetical protein
MALQAAQIKVLKDPRFRAHWPAEASLFAAFEELLGRMGATCPRITAIWTRLMGPAERDLALYDWFKATFPGVPMRAAGGDYARPAPDAKPSPASVVGPRTTGPVNRAINVIQSYRKS